jgi:hypothetical protein
MSDDEESADWHFIEDYSPRVPSSESSEKLEEMEKRIKDLEEKVKFLMEQRPTIPFVYSIAPRLRN